MHFQYGLQTGISQVLVRSPVSLVVGKKVISVMKEMIIHTGDRYKTGFGYRVPTTECLKSAGPANAGLHLVRAKPETVVIPSSGFEILDLRFHNVIVIRARFDPLRPMCPLKIPRARNLETCNSFAPGEIAVDQLFSPCESRLQNDTVLRDTPGHDALAQGNDLFRSVAIVAGRQH